MVRILRAISEAILATASNDPESYLKQEIIQCADDLGYDFIEPDKLDRAVEHLSQDIHGDYDYE